jgi:2',3'-cyclic-nucleotide 2'-phosphodiesterase (5'-nucleotidase family)
VAQLYLEKGIEVWGEQYDVVLGGGFLSVRSPYNLAAGEVRYSDLQSLLPFDNNLVLCSIQGKYLRQRFIETNNSDYFCAYDPSLPSQIEDYETYYIIVDSYSSSYGPNRLTEIARLDEDVFARDLLAEYIKQGGLE